MPAREKRPVEDPLLGWMAAHTPLLATLVLFTFIGIRVLRVASFDPGTAASLVAESGPVTIVMGVLVTALPTLVQGLIYFLILVALGGPGTQTQRRAALAVALVSWLVLIVLLPWLHLVAITAFFVIVAFAQHRLKWPLEVFAVIPLVVVTLLDVPRMWLPAERVESVDREPLVAYVVDVDSEWTTLLRESDRRILVVPTEHVQERTVCNVEPVTQVPTIGQLLFGELGGPRNPPCPQELS